MNRMWRKKIEDELGHLVLSVVNPMTQKFLGKRRRSVGPSHVSEFIDRHVVDGGKVVV